MGEYGRIRLWASAGWAAAVVPFGWWFQRVGTGPVLPVYAAGFLMYVLLLSRFPAPRPLAAAREQGEAGIADVESRLVCEELLTFDRPVSGAVRIDVDVERPRTRGDR